MNPPNALAGLRIGCVQYLNSRPLIHGLPDVELAHPSQLAARLRAGALDAALVPVVELLRTPERYLVVDGVGIGSAGPVYSVFVAHQRPIEELEAVTGDPASLTSIHLFQVLASGVLKRRVALLPESAGKQTNAALGRLLIGNQAIACRMESERAGDGVQFWDLGEQWTAWTGMPFVYAVWVLRRGLAGAPYVADAFRAVSEAGQRAISEIAEADTDFGEDFATRYLKEHIRFQCGASERAGLARFSEELERLKLVEENRASLEFV